MTSFYTLGANYFINNQDFDKINKLTELINQNFVESVNIKSIILRNLKKYKFSCNRLNSLLDGSKIKLIILVESYNFINKVLISVAHKKNIYVCELQHGSIGTSHIAYNYAYGQTINSLPDEIFLWGKYWANRIRIPSKLSVTGFPYIENHAFNLHHSKINITQSKSRFAFHINRGYGINKRHDGIIIKNLVASYSHLRDSSKSRWIKPFLKFVRDIKNETKTDLRSKIFNSPVPIVPSGDV